MKEKKVSKSLASIRFVVGMVLCLFLINGLANSVKGQGNEVRVTGTVTSSQSGETLPGVNILIVGTQKGTTSGVDGKFELTVPSENDTLRFSFIGYQTKIVPVRGRSTINVALKQATVRGEEVMVTGYLTQSTSDVISSVSTVNSEDLQLSSTTNLSSMLQGKTSGVYVSNSSGQPGGNPTVLIRGLGSISAGSSPLYVIDGMPASANDVDPNNVASVNVLKGPAATAIYGSRAANGVVQITTKSGSASTKQTNFEVKVSSGIGEALKGNLHFMNGSQFLEYYHAAGQNAPQFVDSTASTDWWNLIFNQASINKYSVSASSGTEKDQFYISGNYYGNTGTRIGDDYKRFSARANYQHKFSDRFTVNAKIHGNFTKESQNATAAGQVIGAAYRGVPWDEPYNENGELVKGVVGDNWLTRDIRNPLWALQWDYVRTRTNHVSIQPELTYNITDNLSFITRNKYSFTDSRTEEYRDRRTAYGASTNGSLTNSNDYSSTLQTSNLLKYRQDIGNHNINAVAGFEFLKEDGSIFSAVGTGILNFEVLNLAATPNNVGGSKYEYAFISQFLQANYNYNRTYYLTASIRRDGSSRFGEDNRYSNFYAIGGGWELSNESFFNFEFVDQLKLRAAYGKTGNAQIGNYAAQSLQGYGIKYAGTPGSYPQILGNKALTWEKQQNLQVGLDIKLLDSRIELTIDGYQKKNDNLLQAVPLAFESGFTEQLQNIGQVRNRGVEVSLSTTNIRSDNFLWTTSFNVSKNNNEVTSLYKDNEIILGNQIIDVGSSMNTWYLRKWAGVDPQTGLPQWEKVTEGPNGSKQVQLTSNYNEATRQKVGSSIPKWYGGITNNLSYKGFTLYTTFNYIGGYKVYSEIVEQALSDGENLNSNQLDLTEYDQLRRWEQPGDEDATVPFVSLGGNNLSNGPSTRYLYDAGYLRLQQVKVSYSLPTDFEEQLNMHNVTFYVDGNNLWTLTDSDYIGPDPSSDLSGNQGGRTKYPNSRTIMFGIDIEF